MELTITSMTPADRLYAYNQSSQLEGQTGCIVPSTSMRS